MRARGAILVSLAVLLVVPAASSAVSASGLRGKVTLYPARPVCIEGESCSKPAPGALLVFKRDGRVAAKVRSGRYAWYGVRLTPGVYSVAAPEYRIGSGVTPTTVHVPKGRIARVDLEIDSGIQ
jgi:hypothetical protein